MSWLTILGFVAIFVGPWLIADLVFRLRRLLPGGRTRSGTRLGQRHRVPLARSDWQLIAQGIREGWEHGSTRKF